MRDFLHNLGRFLYQIAHRKPGGKGKNPPEKIPKNAMETAPRNCIFLSLVMVERVLRQTQSREEVEKRHVVLRWSQGRRARERLGVVHFLDPKAHKRLSGLLPHLGVLGSMSPGFCKA